MQLYLIAIRLKKLFQHFYLQIEIYKKIANYRKWEIQILNFVLLSFRKIPAFIIKSSYSLRQSRRWTVEIANKVHFRSFFCTKFAQAKRFTSCQKSLGDKNVCHFQFVPALLQIVLQNTWRAITTTPTCVQIPSRPVIIIHVFSARLVEVLKICQWQNNF